MADHPQHAILSDLDGPTSAFSEERALARQKCSQLRLQRRTPEIPRLRNFETFKNYRRARRVKYPYVFLL
jgi:hypothetical protein